MDWLKKKRLKEQLEFFGASNTRFIRCYAKKPKVKVNTNRFKSSHRSTNHLDVALIANQRDSIMRSCYPDLLGQRSAYRSHYFQAIQAQIALNRQQHLAISGPTTGPSRYLFDILGI